MRGVPTSAGQCGGVPSIMPRGSDGVMEMLEQGLQYADVVSTNSEAGVHELVSPGPGKRLLPVFRERQDRLCGVVNGIDTRLFDPGSDSHLVSPFEATTMDLRAANKASLQAAACLPERPEVPLISIISRLLGSSGRGLVSDVLEPVIQQMGCQVIAAGPGDGDYGDVLSTLASRYPDRLAVFVASSEALERRVYAGSDILLMPSRHEPSGRNHMIAMHYGCAPVVHGVGGLADTVPSYAPEFGQGRGFPFRPYDAMALFAATVRAFETHRHHTVWRRLMVRCMTTDFSWDGSGRHYVELYTRALAYAQADAART